MQARRSHVRPGERAAKRREGGGRKRKEFKDERSRGIGKEGEGGKRKGREGDGRKEKERAGEREGRDG
jgi:hypothetical protein